MKNTYFVTGAGGLIGHHLVARILRQSREDRVRALVRPGEDLTNLNRVKSQLEETGDHHRLELVSGDVLDAPRMRELSRDCRTIFHLAAIYAVWLPDPDKMLAVNLQGTRNICEAALENRVERLIMVTSIACFAGRDTAHSEPGSGPNSLPDENSPFTLGRSGDVYARSKYLSRLIARRYLDEGLDIVFPAPCGPVGPGDIGPTPTGQLISLAARFPVLPHLAGQVNLVDVRDVARGIYLAWQKGQTGRDYLLGDRNLSIQDLIGLIGRLTGQKARALPVPPALLAGFSHLWKLAADHSLAPPPWITPAALRISELGLAANADRARRELDLEPRPLETALADSLLWFARHGRLELSGHTRENLKSFASPEESVLAS